MDLHASTFSRRFLSKSQHQRSLTARLVPLSYKISPVLILLVAAANTIRALEVRDGEGNHSFDKHGRELDNSVYHTHVPERTPSFAGPIHNVTVNVGREAVLECPVNHLGQYKVGWLKAKDQTILALHNKVITHNGRIAVDHEEQRIWKLKIRHVQESDRGCYMCQLNTEEMKKQIGCIDVLIPPDIDDRQTSSDVIVHEGEDADLVCKANGHPKPTIEWYREDKGHINLFDPKLNQTRRVNVDRYTGEVLRIKRVQRQQMGAYLCIASNNVPPAVSKRVILNINFAPEIVVPSQLFGVAPGTDVTFSCNVQAFPLSINYWMKNESEMLLNGGLKYNISEISLSTYERRMFLTVKNWQKSDESHFSCIATNSLGKADGRIQSYTYAAKEEVEEKILNTLPESIEAPVSESEKKSTSVGRIDFKLIMDLEQKTQTETNKKRSSNNNNNVNESAKTKKSSSSRNINAALSAGCPILKASLTSFLFMVVAVVFV